MKREEFPDGCSATRAGESQAVRIVETTDRPVG